MYAEKEKLKEQRKMYGHAAQVAAIAAFLALLCYGFCYVASIPWNLQSSSLWLIFIIYYLIMTAIGHVMYRSSAVKKGMVVVGILIITVFAARHVLSSVLFVSQTAANRITVQEGDFDADIPKTADLKKIPLMDSDAAAILGNRAIGELSDVVSQYVLNQNEYSTILYNGKVVKVTPLEYDGIFKWFSNHKNGIPGYVIVDPETNSAKYVKLPNPIRYSMSGAFGENIYRHARAKYPTKMFGNCMFQLDDDGNPVWSLMTYHNERGFSVWKTDGVIVVNAVTGETQWYDFDSVPEWIDSVYTGDNIAQLYDSYGMWQNGYWNSVFSQVGCTRTTDDYGYLAVDNDICIYTGVTSAASDNSNIGFIIVNSRTGEFTFYSSAGADEHSAMAAAEGAVQNYGYQASFPSLINVSGDPVYAMILKDVSGLTKGYAFVNEKHYTVIGTGDTLNEAMRSYQNNMSKNGYNLKEMIDTESTSSFDDVIREMYYLPVDGELWTYIKAESGRVYKGYFNDTDMLFSTGDEITVTCEKKEEEKDVIEMIDLKKKGVESTADTRRSSRDPDAIKDLDVSDVTNFDQLAQ